MADGGADEAGVGAAEKSFDRNVSSCSCDAMHCTARAWASARQCIGCGMGRWVAGGNMGLMRWAQGWGMEGMAGCCISNDLAIW